MIIGFSEATNKGKYHAFVIHWSIDVGKLISQHLKLLTVSGNIREILHTNGSELVFKMNSRGILIILKNILQTIPSLLSGGIGFKNGVKEIVRYRAVDPLEDNGVKAIP